MAPVMNYKTASTLDLLLACNTLMNMPLQGVLRSAALAVRRHAPHPDSSQGEEGKKKMKLLWNNWPGLCCTGRKPQCCWWALSDSAHLTSLLKSLLFTGMAPNRKHFWKPASSLEFQFLPKSQTHSPALDSHHGSRFLLTLLFKAEKPEPFTYFSCPNLNV